MLKRTGSSRRSLHGLLGLIVLTFIISASVVFPGPWNKTVGSIGPSFNEDGFKLGLDLQGGAHLVYEADMSAIPEADRGDALQGVRDVIERRVNAYGVSEPVVQTNSSGGNYRIIVELAGVFNVSEAIKLIGETPILEFKLPNDEVDIDPTEEQQEEIDTAQSEERIIALSILDRALDEESFDDLVNEFSINESTKVTGGYVGFIDENHPLFDGLATEIEEDRIRTGIIDGLYESTSSMHIVNLLSKSETVEPKASHILVCHSESVSCTATLSVGEAQLLAQEIADEVTVRNFEDIAATRSEENDSIIAEDLGYVSEGTMVESFEEALFAMEDGELSAVVETDFGFHIIFREDSQTRPEYEIAHIEMDWTTASDVLDFDIWKNSELSGKHVSGASVAFDQNTNAPYVAINFNPEGGDLFATITEENVGNVIGIFLDGEVISTPVVQQAIYGGSATITGSFNIEEAKLLALRLNAGALPVPIELLSQQTVGPTLGAISLERSVNAALIGFLLVAIFMIAYYRLAGLLAVFSLLVYAAVNLALYRLLGVTMTLAGLAGFVLSLGMAVDANVLIFERLKEELHSGRDLPTAIDEGFRRAWTSIRDGNFTTLIAAAVLFTMSTSFIKGFALTLALGIIVSMLTAILVTRVLLKWTTSFEIFKKKWLYNGPKK